MSEVHVTIEQIRKVNADLIRKSPKVQLSDADKKLYNMIVCGGVLPNDVSLRKIFKDSRMVYNAP